MASRIGIYSGTFDPVHSGHLAFALAAKQACGLDEVVFLPEKQPRTKHGATDISHRVALLEIATKPVEGLRVVALKSEQFTVAETLAELRGMFADAELTLLLGSDVVKSLSHWPGLEDLLGTVELAVGLRAHDMPEEMAVVFTAIHKACGASVRYTCIETPHTHLASSQIRDSEHEATVAHPQIAAYIQQYGLYTT